MLDVDVQFGNVGASQSSPLVKRLRGFDRLKSDTLEPVTELTLEVRTETIQNLLVQDRERLIRRLGESLLAALESEEKIIPMPTASELFEENLGVAVAEACDTWVGKGGIHGVGLNSSDGEYEVSVFHNDPVAGVTDGSAVSLPSKLSIVLPDGMSVTLPVRQRKASLIHAV